MASVSGNAPCPCGSGTKLKRCCRLLHLGGPATSPEALMRSRYCAYALGEIDYLLATTHPEGPQFRRDTHEWRVDLARFCSTTRFEGLEIQASREHDDRGEVSFLARLSREGRDVSFVEHSVFVREAGRWLYFSG